MRLKFWVNTFIPDHLFDMSGHEFTFRVQLLNEAHSAKEMSLIPFLSLLPYLFPCYATDQRSFSADINAPARIKTIIEIPDVLASKVDEITLVRFCHPTVQVDTHLNGYLPPYQNTIDSLTAQSQGETSIDRDNDSIHIKFSSAAANPFFIFAGMQFAPPATLEFDLRINLFDKNQMELILNGDISQFPFFEAYVQLEDREPVTIFQQAAPQGNTPFNLFFGTTKISCHKTLTVLNCEKASQVNNKGTFFSTEKSSREYETVSSPGIALTNT